MVSALPDLGNLHAFPQWCFSHSNLFLFLWLQTEIQSAPSKLDTFIDHINQNGCVTQRNIFFKKLVDSENFRISLLNGSFDAFFFSLSSAG